MTALIFPNKGKINHVFTNSKFTTTSLFTRFSYQFILKQLVIPYFEAYDFIFTVHGKMKEILLTRGWKGGQMSCDSKISQFGGTFTIMPPKSYLPHEKTKIYTYFMFNTPSGRF